MSEARNSSEKWQGNLRRRCWSARSKRACDWKRGCLLLDLRLQEKSRPNWLGGLSGWRTTDFWPHILWKLQFISLPVLSPFILKKGVCGRFWANISLNWYQWVWLWLREGVGTWWSQDLDLHPGSVISDCVTSCLSLSSSVKCLLPLPHLLHWAFVKIKWDNVWVLIFGIPVTY